MRQMALDSRLNNRNAEMSGNAAPVPRRRPPPWVIYLLVVLPIVATYRMLPSAILFSVMYDVIALSCVVAILIGVHVHKPAYRLPWYLLAVGVGMWLSGDVLFTYYEHVLHAAPFPSLAGAIYLASYGFFATGIYLIVRRHTAKGDRSLIIDAAIFTIAAGVLGWLFLMDSYTHDQTLNVAEKLVSIAYPLMDLLILAVLVRVLLGARAWSASYSLLAAGLVLTIASDSVYGLMLLEGNYYPGHVVDFGWLLFYVLWGAAALHPSMAARDDSAARPRKAVRHPRLVLMAGVALLLPTVTVFQRAHGDPMHLIILRAASVAIFLLVIMRMSGIVARLQAAHVRLRTMEREKGKLLDRTMQIGEEERVRVANRLHDGPIQQLSAVAYRFEAGLLQLRRGNHEAAAGVLGSVRDSFGQEIDTLRKMMEGLRSPELDERGLKTALQDLLASFRESSGIHESLEMRVDSGLTKEIETALFRITQEALANAAKYSADRTVRVKLWGDHRVTELTIEDDGIGFDASSATNELADGRFGLIAMRQHAQALGGEFRLTSSSAGTIISARFESPASVSPGRSGRLVGSA